ncbi:LamG-like jellyroll fold domain-containing protein [Planctomicrobium sp. SH664]|uniref:LamG-like jellyroll fold domain-containing protein n=1 Tax=Planctomicrobium sp. SH664 TaxID=3448125 RepID=UPI003F5B24F3
MSKHSQHYLLDLAASVIDGHATEIEVHELEEILQSGGEECRLFLQYAFLNAQLGLTDDVPGGWPGTEEIQRALEADGDASRRSLRSRVPRFARRGVLVAGLAAAAGLFLRPWGATASGSVRFVRSVGPRFAAEPELPQGNLVGKRFQLLEGLVEIGFESSAAAVVVEAPASFSIVDAKTLHVDKGRVSAHVVDGKSGLRVLTPEMNVLDLGTRFAVDVTEKGASEVHVYEGKVEAGDAGLTRASTLVRANEAFRISRGQRLHSCELRTGTFIQPEEILPLKLGLLSGQARSADLASYRIQADAAHLVTISTAHLETCSYCTNNGPRSVQGRFPGRQAFDFLNPDDAIRLNWKPTLRQFTMMTWVRLNQRLQAEGMSSLYHTDEWNTVGQVHWMIDNGGTMRFAIHGGPGGLTGTKRPRTALWVNSEHSLRDQLSRWIHLAVTYNAETQTARMYVDGLLDTESRLEKSLDAVLGPAEIGNWRPIVERKRRRLCGRMDEMVILAREFEGNEIRSYFQQSTPYQ